MIALRSKWFGTLTGALCLCATVSMAQSFADPSATPALELPPLGGITTPKTQRQMPVDPVQAARRTVLTARLTADGNDITRGLIWRVFRPEAGPDGKLPLIASAQGGASSFDLAPGSYLVHASFGRAGATKRITVGAQAGRETLVLDAGGLQLDAVLEDGRKIPGDKLTFNIYDATPGENGERAMIVRQVKPGTVIRLNAGTYHVVSEYGSVNAVIRSDMRVEAGKLTKATVQHRAAQMTLKLVREKGGEAIADTSWSVLTASGDPIHETVGAYASMVLSEGEYTVVAKNRDRIYQKELSVKAGENQDVEVLATDEDALPEGEITD